MSQIEELIIGPFRATQIPTLIIIDALDEIKDEEPTSALLSVLSHYIDDIPFVKFFVTARPESRILAGFHLKSLESYTEVLELDDFSRPLMDNDIKLFLRTTLVNCSKYQSDCEGMEDWPNADDIDALCRRSGGSFAHASTILRFIASGRFDPQRRLATIISLPECAFLNSFHSLILERVACNADVGGKELRIILGAVFLAFSPLSAKVLSDLLKLPQVSMILRHFNYILIIPGDEKVPIQVLHKSFSDLLTDPAQCPNQLFIDPPTHHRGLLLSCLRLMKEKLKKNICDLDDHINLSEVDLSARREGCIGGALEYACCFWADHLTRISAGGIDVEEVQKEIDEFFTTCVLYWVEVLCLTENLSASIHALSIVQEWYASVSYGICF